MVNNGCDDRMVRGSLLSSSRRIVQSRQRFEMMSCKCSSFSSSCQECCIKPKGHSRKWSILSCGIVNLKRDRRRFSMLLGKCSCMSPIAFDLASHCGGLLEMEDAYDVSLDLMGDSCLSMFSVFDGHGGSRAALLANQNFPRILAAEISRRKCISEALHLSMIETDRLLDMDLCGTTATCILMQRCTGEIWSCFVGDTEAWLYTSTDPEPLKLVEPHTPLRADERSRIERQGGIVSTHFVTKNGRSIGRINGAMAISRALGDKHLRQWVIPTPEIIRGKITDACEFLVLASDGLWDVLEPQETRECIVNYVRSKSKFRRRADSFRLKRIQNCWKGCAQQLVLEAIKRETRDNVTCIVLFFPGALKYLSP